MSEIIAPWKCDIGDTVEFHFSRMAAEKGKPALKGIIVDREPKSVSIHITDSEQVVRVHVSLVKVVKAELTNKRIKRVLAKKFNQKPSNKSATTTKKEVTNEVAGMVFKYKKK